MTDQITEYQKRFENHLVDVAKNLRDFLEKILVGIPRIDGISSRAKEPIKFSEKAIKTMVDKSLKYPVPLTDIQDQIGGRVIVFFKDDVEIVKREIKKFFQHIELVDKAPIDNWKFGYFGCHFILPLPKDVIPKDVSEDAVPKYFELQIKTLFQHAWSEANHDVGYKSSIALSDMQERKLAYSAAQSWGADQIFSDLFNELVISPQLVEETQAQN